jgi:hypothetical protein
MRNPVAGTKKRKPETCAIATWHAHHTDPFEKTGPPTLPKLPVAHQYQLRPKNVTPQRGSIYRLQTTRNIACARRTGSANTTFFVSGTGNFSVTAGLVTPPLRTTIMQVARTNCTIHMTKDGKKKIGRKPTTPRAFTRGVVG